MEGGYGKYNAWFKERVLCDYKPGVRGAGAKAVANKHDLPSHNLVLNWFKDSKEEKLSDGRKPGGGRKRRLSDDEAQTHIKEFVVKRNKKGVATNYHDVNANITAKTGKSISLTAVRRIGHDELKLTNKNITRRLAIESSNTQFLLVTAEHEHLVIGGYCVLVATDAYWEGVAATRRVLERTPRGRLIFIDRSQLKVGNGPLTGLAPIGKPAYDEGKMARHWEQGST